MSPEASEDVNRLNRENLEFRKANEIMKSVRVFCEPNLDAAYFLDLGGVFDEIMTGNLMFLAFVLGREASGRIFR